MYFYAFVLFIFIFLCFLSLSSLSITFFLDYDLSILFLKFLSPNVKISNFFYTHATAIVAVDRSYVAFLIRFDVPQGYILLSTFIFFYLLPAFYLVLSDTLVILHLIYVFVSQKIHFQQELQLEVD